MENFYKEENLKKEKIDKALLFSGNEFWEKLAAAAVVLENIEDDYDDRISGYMDQSSALSDLQSEIVENFPDREKLDIEADLILEETFGGADDPDGDQFVAQLSRGDGGQDYCLVLKNKKGNAEIIFTDEKKFKVVGKKVANS
jgi:hypothetical protein